MTLITFKTWLAILFFMIQFQGINNGIDTSKKLPVDAWMILTGEAYNKVNGNGQMMDDFYNLAEDQKTDLFEIINQIDR